MLWNSRRSRILANYLQSKKHGTKPYPVPLQPVTTKSILVMRFALKFLFVPIFGCMLFQGEIWGQITANAILQTRTTEGPSKIEITWSAADEQKWHEENDGRLEIIALNTSISSQALSLGKDSFSLFELDITSGCSVELMIRINQLTQGEQLGLWNFKEQKMVWQVNPDATGRTLTPSFDPLETGLVWRRKEWSNPAGSFSVEKIYYHPNGQREVLDIGFGTAMPCHPNAICKTDSLLQLISRSTVRMRLVMEEGIGWCSGSFINNTRNDKTPYLLSAYHCQWDYTPIYDMWRFDFDYASETCDNPATEPKFFSLTGCELISLGQASDFLLLKLTDDIPFNRQVTFAGWYRDDTEKPDTSYLVHHPNADIRKFSTCVNPVTIHPNQIGWSEGYTTPAHHHFRLKFTEGGHQPGSSGGPFYNQDGLIIGQLHGGSFGCEDDNNTYVGRLSKSWNLGVTPQERLRDWLDPDQTGVMTLQSIENISADDKMDIVGLVTDPAGRPVKNATIQISGSVEETMVTGDDGAFVLNGVSRQGQYTITPAKNTNPTNGLSAIDLVAIQKHLLGKDTFNVPWKFIAADATNNVDLSVGDILLLLRLMLGKIQTLPSSPSWRFDPPSQVLEPSGQGGPVEVQFTAIKIGDLNTSADPKK